MTKETAKLPVIDIKNIKFDAHGRYEILELTETELMEVSGGGSSANNFFCPQGSNIFYCPTNNGCPPPPSPPPSPGEDTDGE